MSYKVYVNLCKNNNLAIFYKYLLEKFINLT